MTAPQDPIEGSVTSPAKAATRPRWLRPLLGLFLLAAAVAAYAAGLHSYLDWDFIKSNVEDWRQQVRDNPLASALIFCGTYITLTALSIPAAGALTLLSGALFDRWLGVTLTSVSSTTGGTLAFLASRYLFHDWVRRHFGDRLRVIDEGVRRDGAFYLFSLRLTPVVPYFLVNFGMAVTPMRLGTFIFASWLGMLLPTYLYVNAGRTITNIQRPADALSAAVIGSLVLLAVVPIVIRWLLGGRAPA